MGRTAWFDAKGMKKGEWTAEEDKMLVAYINEYGLGDWRVLPKKAGLQRCGKSCRLRWLNYLRPGIKRGKFSPEEEEEIIKSHALLGNRWAAIAKQMPNRTDNDIKNHWNSCLKKRLARNGIDPVTHELILTVEVTSPSTTSSSTPCTSSSISSSSFSASTRLLNKLASRKQELGRLIKNVIQSEPSDNGEALEEKKIIKEEEIGCFMEIDENLISTTSFDESTSFVDYSLSVDPYGLYQSDFLETDVQLDMFLL